MYKDFLDSPIGILEICADEKEILSLAVIETPKIVEPSDITDACRQQLIQYFKGIRKVFELPLRIGGTKFQQAVFRELSNIAYGETRSYSDVATAVGRPRAQRAVGQANHLNSLPILIPCHRVIGKDKRLTGYALGLDVKAWLLRHESL